MIGQGDIVPDLSDPLTLGLIAGGAALGLLLLLTGLALRAAGRAARAVEPLGQAMGGLSRRVQSLGDAQQQLAGGLSHVSEGTAQSQSRLLEVMERRLEEVQKGMADTLHGTSTRTARSLGELHEKLQRIDRAQAKIEQLSGDVLSLQDILSNKQRRGLFGEIQLHDIVGQALPPDAYDLQATLSNGRRADCLVKLPLPPGPIVIDAKFPLEAYEALVAAEGADAQKRALRELGVAVRGHLRAIAERYIVAGETADGALMFLPSEAVYAELHARLPEIVREGFAMRVWIVSPTTCMATLNTIRAVLKDARMREQAGEIRKALRHLHRDVALIEERAGKLETHLQQAGDDVAGIRTASARAGKRAERLDSFDFADEATEDPEVVPLPRR